VNVEVLRLRAVPGGDAGALARFAAAGAAQLEDAVRLVDAVLALARAPRGTADVAVALKQFAALLAPAAASDGVTLDPGELPAGAPTDAPPEAVRLAVAEALLAGLAAAGVPERDRPAARSDPAPSAAPPASELEGAEPARPAARAVRCTLAGGAMPTLRVEADGDVRVDDALAALLRTREVRIGYEGAALLIAFPRSAG
jgi:hypothetical protein